MQNNDLYRFEKQYARHYHFIAGGDEAGRGCLAGPVAAALVILDPSNPIPGLKDSKLLSVKKREMLYQEIKNKALAWQVSYSDHQLIDRINILQATKEGFNLAFQKMSIQPDFILLDALNLEKLSVEQLKLIKGERQSASIAAASIMAKVSRDRLMLDYHFRYPLYGFDQHKGYGTRYHCRALAAHGPCPIHRQTFKPVSSYVSGQT